MKVKYILYPSKQTSFLGTTPDLNSASDKLLNRLFDTKVLVNSGIESLNSAIIARPHFSRTMTLFLEGEAAQTIC